MKYLQRLLLLSAISLGVFSCQKEYSVENNTGGSNVTAQWSFKEGGIEFKGPIDTAGVDSIGNYKVFSINGHSDDKKDLINLEFFGTDLKIGTYKTPYCLFAYSRNGIITYQTNQTAVDSFTIVVTKLDSTGVIGTFSGKAWDSTKNYKTIVDGKFSAVFKTSIPPASTDSGQVVLWSKAGCGGGTSTTPINVSVNGKAGQITQFGNEPTTCDPAGRYFVKLPVGTYPWTATCGSNNIGGTVTVTKGGCSKVQVDFTAPSSDYFPTTKNSNWSYSYEGSSDTLYTFSTGNSKTFATNAYTIFTNTDGSSKDSSYYRKLPGYYYEYVTAVTDTAAGGIKIPAYEYTFLRDNLAKGATYSSSSISATISGIAVTMKLTSTVLDNTTTVTINNQSLPVIKMRHVYSYLPPVGASQDFYAVEEWFAKGVGLIKFIDYADAPYTTPSDNLNLTKATIY